MPLKGTKTEENLLKALAGESIARNKYTYYAQVARENGDTHIAEAFEQMAKNEMMHAKFWFEALYGKPESTDACLMQAGAVSSAARCSRSGPTCAVCARPSGPLNMWNITNNTGKWRLCLT